MNDNDTRFLWLSRNIAIFIYGYAFGQTGGQRSGFFRGNTGKAAAANPNDFPYLLWSRKQWVSIFRNEGSAGNSDLCSNTALCRRNNMKNCTALAADLIAGAKRENNTGSISGRRKCNGVGGDARIRRVVFCNKSLYSPS